MDGAQEFRAPKLANGKEVKDKDGNLVFDTYVYDFNQMGMDRKLWAETYFKLYQTAMINPPKTGQELQLFASCRHETRAFAALLMKRLEDGKFEPYYPDTTELSAIAWSALGQGDDYERLKECKMDFFQRAGLQFAELTLQSNATMKLLGDTMNEITKLAGEAKSQGLEVTKDFLETLLDKAKEMSPSLEN